MNYAKSFMWRNLIFNFMKVKLFLSHFADEETEFYVWIIAVARISSRTANTTSLLPLKMLCIIISLYLTYLLAS